MALVMASDEIYALVRALRRDARTTPPAFSRNRNFEAHATPEARAARRIHKFLRAIEADLRRAATVTATPKRGGGVQLVLAMPSVRMRRTVELEAPALALLLEDEEWAARFGAVRSVRVA